MTLSSAMMDRLAARGLDIELIDRLGLDGASRGGREALVIPFRRRGQVVRRKYRMWDGEQRWSADAGAERIAWNEDCLLDAALHDQPLIITEGEFDAITAIQCGFPRAISVPDGAPPPGERDQEMLEQSRKYSWLEEIKPLLHKDHVPHVILAVDGDENGAALLQDLSVLLGRSRCKFVTYPLARDPASRGRARLKDLNEVLEDYGPKGVAETIGKAQWLKVDGVYHMSDLPPLPETRVYDIGFEAFGEHFKLRLGDFSVWTGTPGAGKTSALQDIACRVAELHGLKIGWASFEQAPQRDHRRAFREWFCRGREWGLSSFDREAADAWIDQHHVFLVPKEDEDVTLNWLLEKMEVAVVRYGANWIIVDPWNEMDHYADNRETEVQYIVRAIRTLRRFARAFQIHLTIVAHPIKLQKNPDGKYPTPSLYDIHGGAVWYNKADLGVVLVRENDTDTKWKVAKSRYHDIIGRPGTVIVQYCADDRHFREIERVPGAIAPNLAPMPRRALPQEPRELLNPDVALAPMDAQPTASDLE